MDTQTPFTDINAGANTTQPTTSAFTDAQPTTQSAFTDIQPSDVTKAEQYSGSEDFEGLCETFAEQMTNSPRMGATAYEAWNNWTQQGRTVQGNVQQAPAGSLVYFAPDGSNQGDGHVAIALGNGGIISPDYTGVHYHKLQDWIQNTGQTPLGYVPMQ